MDQIWQRTLTKTESLRNQGLLVFLFMREIYKIYYEEKEVCDANVAGNSHPIRVRHSLWAFSFYICANKAVTLMKTK